MEELFSLVSSMSWVRHAVLSYFQWFKLENRELMAPIVLIKQGAAENPCQ